MEAIIALCLFGVERTQMPDAVKQCHSLRIEFRKYREARNTGCVEGSHRLMELARAVTTPPKMK